MKEMQVKITRRRHPIIRMAIIKKSKYAEDVDKNSHAVEGECKLVQPLWKAVGNCLKI